VTVAQLVDDFVLAIEAMIEDGVRELLAGWLRSAGGFPEKPKPRRKVRSTRARLHPERRRSAPREKRDPIAPPPGQGPRAREVRGKRPMADRERGRSSAALPSTESTPTPKVEPAAATEGPAAAAGGSRRFGTRDIRAAVERLRANTVTEPVMPVHPDSVIATELLGEPGPAPAMYTAGQVVVVQVDKRNPQIAIVDGSGNKPDMFKIRLRKGVSGSKFSEKVHVVLDEEILRVATHEDLHAGTAGIAA
jgi:hypothetical protein